MLMASAYYKNLIQRVIDASEGATWEASVSEWEIVDCEEDEDCESFCICGKENIRYLYTIRNVINGNLLYPIGSSCIRKFGNENMDEEINIREGMFVLYRAVRNNENIELSTKYFSRKLLYALFDEGAFRPTEYNQRDGYNDYTFLLDMFNKRDKSSITYSQRRKINAIIGFSIKPYLQKTLKFKDAQL